MEKRYVILEYDEHEGGDRWETILPSDTTLNAAKGYALEESRSINKDRRIELTYIDCLIDKNYKKYSTGTIIDDNGYNPINYRPLPLYIYRGQVGVIYNNDFIPEDKVKEMGLTVDDCLLCYDDTVYNGNQYSKLTGITYQPIINDENEQKLSSQWVYVDTAREDRIKQKYLTITDQYYDWKSDITQCVEQIEDTINTYFFQLDNLIKEYLSRAQKDINNCLPEVEVYSMDDVINFLVNQFSGNLKEFVEIITAAWRAKNGR